MKYLNLPNLNPGSIAFIGLRWDHETLFLTKADACWLAEELVKALNKW